MSGHAGRDRQLQPTKERLEQVAITRHVPVQIEVARKNDRATRAVRLDALGQQLQLTHPDLLIGAAASGIEVGGPHVDLRTDELRIRKQGQTIARYTQPSSLRRRATLHVPPARTRSDQRLAGKVFLQQDQVEGFRLRMNGSDAPGRVIAGNPARQAVDVVGQHRQLSDVRQRRLWLGCGGGRVCRNANPENRKQKHEQQARRSNPRRCMCKRFANNPDAAHQVNSCSQCTTGNACVAAPV